MPMALKSRNLARMWLGFLIVLWTNAGYGQAIPAAQQTGEKPRLTQDNGAQTRHAAAIEDVTVTARRRAERLQDVPVAATTFSHAQLGRYATQSVAALSAQTPELIVGSPSNTTGGLINLRGIGSPTSGPTIDQAVSINIDGIQFSQANVLRLGLYDLDRIEVLKGPQALFYGKNSPAGIISITSDNPTDHFETTVRTGYEFANELKYVEATVSGPLSNTLGGRIDGFYGNQNGWFQNSATPIPSVTVPRSLGGGTTGQGVGASTATAPSMETIFLRGTLTYKAPSGVVDANLKAAYSQQSQSNGLDSDNQILSCAGNAPQYAISLGLAGNQDCRLNRRYNEANFSPEIRALNPRFGDGSPYDNSKQFLGALTVNVHPTNTLTITSVTGYYKLDEAETGNFSLDDLSSTASVLAIRQEQLSEEVRALTSFHAPLNFMIGAYGQHVSNQADSLNAFDAPLSSAFSGGHFNTPIVAANNTETQKTNAFSIFGQAIIDLTRQIQITGGARYSQEAKNVYAVSFPNSFTNSTFDVPISPDNRDFHNISPEATVTYKVLPTLTVYGAYRQGFTSGGFDLNQATVGFGKHTIGDISFEQETVTGGEIGARGSLGHRQFVFDLNAYDYTYKDLQLSAFDATTLGFRITNAGSAEVRGFEGQFQIRPNQIQGLTLRPSFAFNEGQFGSFRNAPCYVGQSPGAGCNLVARGASNAVTVVPVASGQTANAQDLSGRTLPRAPKWDFNLGGTYVYELHNGLNLSTSLDETYTGSYWSDTTEEPFSRQDAAWRLNANLTLAAQNDRWQVSIIGTNLTQVLRAAQAYTLAGTGGKTGNATAFRGDEVGTVTLPRTITMQLTIKY